MKIELGQEEIGLVTNLVCEKIERFRESPAREKWPAEAGELNTKLLVLRDRLLREMDREEDIAFRRSSLS